MKRYAFIGILLGILVFGACSKKRPDAPKVLVFSKTLGFKHASIESGIQALQQLGAEHGFEIDTTKNAQHFTDTVLQKYSAIVFLSTTGNVLDHQQEAAFERYIQAGGGFVGIHAATDTEYDWGWYNRLVGAYFLSHPPGAPEADFVITDKNFSATAFFQDSIWRRRDEIYNFKKINHKVNVVMRVDESSYEGGKHNGNHPIAWYHEYDGGRAFYTALGHTHESYSEPEFLKHLKGGLDYAIGDNLELDYDKATTQIPPDTDRFSKKTLVEGEFFEPTEMTILPNNDVLIAQRRGHIAHYNAATGETKEVAKLDVYFKTLQAQGVNAEEGLMGLQKDPNYAENHWVYVYYSPTGDEWVNRLSRFKFKDGVFEMASEQKILDVGSQREICCHTGGSIAFDKNGLLYLSTGDNTTPFNEKGAKYSNNGFAPLNDLPGKKQYNAARSSGNTNDLRGKIIRIKVNDDGSYDIPEGNLFAVGTEKTRPEIYTMGHRNPYRISIDQKNGYVYWGDVGPDSGRDNFEKRGPRGYDEMNQAKSAGNFGWPFFIADNKPYVAYDYETGESGAAFDPEKPVNNSKYNTGLTKLPPARGAYVFYPYAETGDFPQVGNGGRNAMAGPVYYSDMYEDGGSLPDYYDGRVIIYDWIRGWMKAATFFDDGTFNKMEPFAPEVTVNSLIDMEMGPDGRLYLLEYGKGWFSKNEDSSLGYIEFNPGNRPPVVDNMSIDNDSGKLPLSIKVMAAVHDPENDDLSFVWNFGDGATEETTVPEVDHTYTTAGLHKISVTVKDTHGKETLSESVAVVAGNSRPVVSIGIKNKDLSDETFQAGGPIAYNVVVEDPDGGKVDTANFFISVDYLESLDRVNMTLGHQQVSAAVSGKGLTQGMDCKTCHKEVGKSIGPSYFDVAQRHAKNLRAMEYLPNKIIKGGGGAWGEVVMPAHPDVTADEARQIATYIMSLAENVEKPKSMPPSGSFVAEPKKGDRVMILTATYTDNGAEGAIPLTGKKSLIFERKEVREE